MFTTPESRRKFGEIFWESDPNAAVAWIARAYLEERGGLSEFEAARDAWEAARPREVNFMPARDAIPLLERRDAALEKLRSEFERTWGPLTPVSLSESKETTP